MMYFVLLMLTAILLALNPGRIRNTFFLAMEGLVRLGIRRVNIIGRGMPFFCCRLIVSNKRYWRQQSFGPTRYPAKLGWRRVAHQVWMVLWWTLYRLPWQTVQSAHAGTAQLRDSGNFSWCYCWYYTTRTDRLSSQDGQGHYSSRTLLLLGSNQRHILRNRRPSTAACPAFLAMGDKGIEIVYDEKKISYTGAAKVEQKSLVPARQAKRTNQGRASVNCTLWVPIHVTVIFAVPLFSMANMSE